MIFLDALSAVLTCFCSIIIQTSYCESFKHLDNLLLRGIQILNVMKFSPFLITGKVISFERLLTFLSPLVFFFPLNIWRRVMVNHTFYFHCYLIKLGSGTAFLHCVRKAKYRSAFLKCGNDITFLEVSKFLCTAYLTLLHMCDTNFQIWDLTI